MTGVVIKVFIWTQKQAHLEGRWCEDTGRRRPSTSPGERPGADPALTASKGPSPANTVILNSQPPQLWDNRFLLFKPPHPAAPVCSTLLWQPEQIKTGREKKRERLREQERLYVKLYIHLEELTLKRNGIRAYSSMEQKGSIPTGWQKFPKHVKTEHSARCQEPDSPSTGGVREGEGTLPSGSPLWTSGMSPCAQQRSGRWQSGTESHGRCLGASLGKQKAEDYWGGLGNEASATHSPWLMSC